MEWLQYYSIACWVIFIAVVLIGMSYGLLALFVRVAAALGEEPPPVETKTDPDGNAVEPAADTSRK